MGGGPLTTREAGGDDSWDLQYGSNSPSAPMELELGKSDLTVDISFSDIPTDQDVSRNHSRVC